MSCCIRPRLKNLFFKNMSNSLLIYKRLQCFPERDFCLATQPCLRFEHLYPKSEPTLQHLFAQVYCHLLVWNCVIDFASIFLVRLSVGVLKVLWREVFIEVSKIKLNFQKSTFGLGYSIFWSLSFCRSAQVSGTINWNIVSIYARSISRTVG